MISGKSGTPKVRRRPLKKTTDVSYEFSVVKNQRNPITRRPDPIVLAYIGSFRISEFEKRAVEFWETVDTKLSELVASNVLWQNDRLRAEAAFAKYIPRPSITAITLTAANDPDPSNSEEIIRILASRGIQLLSPSDLPLLR